MSYAKRMTPEMRLYIGHIIEKIEALKPGQSILIKGNDERHINNVRNHFYSWCHLYDKKALYRTYKETPITLRILCLDTRPVEILQDVPLNKIEEFVRDHLLDCEDEHAARNKMQPALAQGIIDEDDVFSILMEFKRVQG